MSAIAGRRPLIPSPVLGMAIFLVTEVMLFAGLLSAYWVLRGGYAQWPPPGQPRLPAVLTGINTVVLASSLLPLSSSLRRARAGEPAAPALLTVAIIGSLFLLLQGVEWVRLISFGLTARTGPYGSIFYTIIGVHAAHAIGGLAALLHGARRAARGAYSPAEHSGLDAIRLYWGFVVLVWPVLYVLVYVV